ncbi:hypothetical protein MTO96_028242 [Rhipicephalus appendiculatus]
MPSFEAFPLPDIRRTFHKIVDVKVGLSQGKLYGLSNLKLSGSNYINATEGGIRARFAIDGGPLEVTYTGTLRSVLLNADVMVSARTPRIQLFIAAHERRETKLYLDHVMFIADPVTFKARQMNESRLVVDFLTILARYEFEREIERNMQSVIATAVHHFLGQVELFAVEGAKMGEIKNPREDPTHIPGIVLPGRGGLCYSDYPLGPSKSGIFDCSIWRMTMASKLDPLVLTDVDDVTWGGILFHITNVTVRGLSSLRRAGDNYAVADECGISAGVSLAMENIRVRLYATTDILAVRLRLDVRIVGVDVVLKVKETDKTMEIEDYQLNFTQPLEYDLHVLTPIVGPVVEVTGLLKRWRLTEDQTHKLEDHSRKYIERVVRTVTEFIKDPAPWMPWDRSVIDAYRRYLEEHQE